MLPVENLLQFIPCKYQIPFFPASMIFYIRVTGIPIYKPMRYTLNKIRHTQGAKGRFLLSLRRHITAVPVLPDIFINAILPVHDLFLHHNNGNIQIFLHCCFQTFISFRIGISDLFTFRIAIEIYQYGIISTLSVLTVPVTGLQTFFEFGTIQPITLCQLMQFLQFHIRRVTLGLLDLSHINLFPKFPISENSRLMLPFEIFTCLFIYFYRNRNLFQFLQTFILLCIYIFHCSQKIVLHHLLGVGTDKTGIYIGTFVQQIQFG